MKLPAKNEMQVSVGFYLLAIFSGLGLKLFLYFVTNIAVCLEKNSECFFKRWLRREIPPWAYTRCFPWLTKILKNYLVVVIDCNFSYFSILEFFCGWKWTNKTQYKNSESKNNPKMMPKESLVRNAFEKSSAQFGKILGALYILAWIRRKGDFSSGVPLSSTLFFGPDRVLMKAVRLSSESSDNAILTRGSTEFSFWAHFSNHWISWLISMSWING